MTVDGLLALAATESPVTVRLAVLVLLTLVAAVTDLTRHKIYNWLTYPGMLLGLLLNGLESGWPGVEDALTGWAVCGGILVVCLVLFNIGGGDVKLVAMLGAFLGLHQGIEAMLWTFVIGGALGVCVVIWQVGAWRLLAGTIRHLYLVVRLARWIPPDPHERQILQRVLYLAPSSVLAVLLTCWSPWG